MGFLCRVEDISHNLVINFFFTWVYDYFRIAEGST